MKNNEKKILSIDWSAIILSIMFLFLISGCQYHNDKEGNNTNNDNYKDIYNISINQNNSAQDIVSFPISNEEINATDGIVIDVEGNNENNNSLLDYLIEDISNSTNENDNITPDFITVNGSLNLSEENLTTGLQNNDSDSEEDKSFNDVINNLPDMSPEELYFEYHNYIEDLNLKKTNMFYHPIARIKNLNVLETKKSQIPKYYEVEGTATQQDIESTIGMDSFLKSDYILKATTKIRYNDSTYPGIGIVVFRKYDGEWKILSESWFIDSPFIIESLYNYSIK